MINSRIVRAHLIAVGAATTAGTLTLSLVTAPPSSNGMKAEVRAVQLAALTLDPLASIHKLLETFSEPTLPGLPAAAVAAGLPTVVVPTSFTGVHTAQAAASSTQSVQASSKIGNLGDKVCAVIGLVCGYALLNVLFWGAALGRFLSQHQQFANVLGRVVNTAAKLFPNIRKAIARLLGDPSAAAARALAGQPGTAGVAPAAALDSADISSPFIPTGKQSSTRRVISSVPATGIPPASTNVISETARAMVKHSPTQRQSQPRRALRGAHARAATP